MKRRYELEPFGAKALAGQERWIERGPIALRLDSVGPEEITQVARRLKARSEQAHERSLMENVEALHQVGQLWADPNYPLRQEALDVLPVLTNLSPAMVEHELEEMCQTLRRDTLLRWIELELGSLDILESWVERGNFRLHRQPRGLVFHNLSGNAFLLPMLCLTFNLLTKNTSLVKLASAEPYFGIRFAESLRQIDPTVADDIAVLYWSAQNSACYEALFQQRLGAAVAWGDLRTVRVVSSLAGKYRTRFIDHGARFGIAVVDQVSRRELPRVVRDLARDIVPWEEYACISPPFIFVTDGEVTAREFAEALLEAMDTMCLAYQQKPSPARASTIVSNREYYCLKLELDDCGQVLASDTTASTVVYSEKMPTMKDFQMCSGRFVMVCRTPGLGELYQTLTNNGLQDYVQAVAFHGRTTRFLDQLTLAGISHITEPGSLNTHQVGFSHDGVFNLQELTTLVTRYQP